MLKICNLDVASHQIEELQPWLCFASNRRFVTEGTLGMFSVFGMFEMFQFVNFQWTVFFLFPKLPVLNRLSNSQNTEWLLKKIYNLHDLGLVGLEPTIATLWAPCSNRLNYKPFWWLTDKSVTSFYDKS